MSDEKGKFIIKKPGTKLILIAFSFVMAFLAMIIAVTVGNFHIPVSDVFDIIFKKLMGESSESNNYVLVWEVRLPRIFLAALGGIGLAVSGAVFQGIFKNPLVEPYILGVSSGAACGAALSIVFLGTLFPVSLLAFVFAMLAMVLAYTVATKGGSTPIIRLILAGVVIASIFTAILNLLKTLAPDSKLREITFWTMGGFYSATWESVLTLLPVIIAGFLILCSFGWKINVLSLGDEEARSLGISVGRVKILSLGLATLLTASVVSQVGIVSWVGLMIPHAARMIIGPDHRYLIPFSALSGAAFMIVCDTIARTFILGEIPISIVTSILGAPYLIYLLRSNRQVIFG